MFNYTKENIEKIVKSISEDRLSTYLNVQNGDIKSALELYLKNIEYSASLFVPLQGLEVALRNSLNDVICVHYDKADWFDDIPLNDGAKKIIKRARKTAQKNRENARISHVVAELPLGFWLSMLNKSYHQSLWIPFLHKAFPEAKKARSEIHERLDHIRTLRNRIAHHEPIFKRHLEQDYQSIIEVLSWICPETAEWIKAHSLDGYNKIIR